jgi:DNA-binding NarL/FixJ family response regulator
MVITLLVAAGHGLLRQGICSLLERQEDIRILGVAVNGQEAVNETLRLRPHVVLMDVAMPVLSGIEATRAIVAAQPETAVLVLSMHDSPPVIHAALDAGARGYLCKKAAAAELVKALRQVAAGKRYLAPGIASQAARRGANAGVSTLTSTEREILRYAAEGKSNVEMAALLGLTARTVETYRGRMMRKLDLSDMAALVKFALQHGIVSLD